MLAFDSEPVLTMLRCRRWHELFHSRDAWRRRGSRFSPFTFLRLLKTESEFVRSDSGTASDSGPRGGGSEPTTHRSSQLPLALLLQSRGSGPHKAGLRPIEPVLPSHVVVGKDSCWAVHARSAGLSANCRAVQARSAWLCPYWAYPGALRKTSVASASGSLLIILSDSSL
jgi:hypothetical protein